jgi:hypothetical protein
LFKSDLQTSTQGLNLALNQRLALIQSADRLGDTQPPAGLDDVTRAAVNQAIDRSLVGTFRVVGVVCAALGVLGGLVALCTVEGGLFLGKPARGP